MSLFEVHQGPESTAYSIARGLCISPLVAQLDRGETRPKLVSDFRNSSHTREGKEEVSATYKHGAICCDACESIEHVADAAVIHHSRRCATVDLVVGEVNGIGEHNISNASRHAPPSRRGTHDYRVSCD
jgi:hypothetical protein